MFDLLFAPVSGAKASSSYYTQQPLFPPGPMPMLVQDNAMVGIAGGSQRPDLGHLILLVFEAVMEVVVIATPGFMLARAGMFPARTQKEVANINMTIFTPCLIFSKLAAQLEGDKLKDLVIIPVIFAAQTLVSWLCAMLAVRVLKLRTKPQRNFVIAMSVFGNSNSLPLSLIMSLSKTISGLHWAKIPGDNDNEVGARGILYLLIFSQLGQALRWSWGASSLLKPLDQYTAFERGELAMTEEERVNSIRAYRDHSLDVARSADSSASSSRPSSSHSSLLIDSDSTAVASPRDLAKASRDPQQAHLQQDADGSITTIKPNADENDTPENPENPKLTTKLHTKLVKPVTTRLYTARAKISASSRRTFSRLPSGLQKLLRAIARVFASIYAALNLPLIAIIVSVVVAVVPPLKALFFQRGTFVNNAVTHAVQSMGGVAVPMIITVLGANLAPNTLPSESKSAEFRRTERRMLIASLVCRMVLCTAFMLPLLAIFAKFVPVSILGDPIFIIVCFLLSGAPSALQLAQICQVNEVFLGAVSKLLFHSYVIWILPSTIFLVVVALEVVAWAGR